MAAEDVHAAGGDEQAALQQKMMQYMMVFMGIMFFKVASGLCVYFIASSLWGICERKLLPKPAPKVDGMGTPITVPPVSSNGNGASGGKKRHARSQIVADAQFSVTAKMGCHAHACVSMLL